MKILVGNGHGMDTPGKCSPDGTFKEWIYTRLVAREVVKELQKSGYDAELLVTETTDVPLKERVRRVNNKCTIFGTKNVLYLSIHVNAASNGNWTNARGFSCFTSKGQTVSDKVASVLYEVAEEIMPEQKFRKDYSDGDPDWESNFYVLKNTLCAAVLTENFFMDNKEDLEYLNSEEGFRNIVYTHVEGISRYLSKYNI